MLALLGSLLFGVGAAVLCDDRTARSLGVADYQRDQAGGLMMLGGAMLLFLQARLWFGPAAIGA
jgi:hypothetical protein